MRLRSLYIAAITFALLHLWHTSNLMQPVAIWSSLACFGALPGLALLGFRAAPIRVLHLPLAVLISLVISASLFSGLLLIGSSAVEAASITTVIVILLPVVAMIRRSPTLRLSRGDKQVLLAAVLAGTVLGVVLQSDGLMVSWHGFFHTAVTEQILTEGVPPSNPAIAGLPLNYNWGFHTFIALLTVTSGAHPLIAMASLNVLMFVVIIVAVYAAGKRLILRRGDRALVPAALFGVINIGVGPILLAKYIRYGSLPFDRHSDGQWLDWLCQRAIPSRIWDGRVSSFIKEFHDMSAMATGLCFLVVYFAMWINWRRSERHWHLPMICVLVFGVVISYPPLAILILLHQPLACVLSARSEMQQDARWLRSCVIRLAASGVAVAATVPYVVSTTDRSAWEKSGEAFMAIGSSMGSVVHAISPFIVLVPLVLVGVWRWKRSFRKLPVVMAITGATMALLLALVLEIQDGGQYKFVYAGAPFVAIFSVSGWIVLRESLIHTRRIRRVATAMVWSTCLYVPVVFVFGACTSTMYGDESVHVEGRTLTRTDDPAVMDALTWIRDNTPRDSILLVSLIVHRRTPSNPGFENATIAQRAGFLVYDVFHSVRFAQFAPRAEAYELLLHGESEAAAELVARLQPTRPVYAIVKTQDDTQSFPGWDVKLRRAPYAVLAMVRND